MLPLPPSMVDTLAVAQQLAAGGVDRNQAEVIAKAIHNGLEQGDHVTSDQFRAGLAVHSRRPAPWRWRYRFWRRAAAGDVFTWGILFVPATTPR